MEHYKNKQQKCHPDSRCKHDTNYEPKRTVLPIPIAEKRFLCVIQKFTIYTNSEDFVLAKDTCYVESFNNTMKMFQDNRFAFSNGKYQAISQLVVCHWDVTVAMPQEVTFEKRTTCIIIQFIIPDSIWSRQINSFFLKKTREELIVIRHV